MRKLILIWMFTSVALSVAAQEVDSMQLFLDSLEASFTYQKGEIKFENGVGAIQVPAGFRYLDPIQSERVLVDIWGNPSGAGTLGMIVPENAGVTHASSWAFIVTYDEMGYVEDDDAEDMDYDELLEDLQKETVTENEERKTQGYEPITLVGWASKPFYDADKKVLHWAKELKFGEDEDNTLNYNVRVLGRKGVIILNAVAPMTAYSEVEKNIQPILSSFTYADGYKYSDFNPEIDEVAAWTVGGLVAGKVLAKAGFLALLLKNIKLIGLALVAAATGLWKWFKNKTEPPAVKNITGDNQTNQS